MGSNSILYVGEVAMNAPDDANMFSITDKLNIGIVDDDRGYCFLVINKELLAGGRKYHKFGFLGSKSDMVGRTVVKSQLKKVVS